MRPLISDIGQYAVAITKDWISLISGILGVVALVIGLFTEFAVGAQARYWYWAFAIGYAIASFRVWQKNQPCLDIEVLDTFLVVLPKGAGLTFTVRLQVINRLVAVNSFLGANLWVVIEGKQTPGKTRFRGLMRIVTAAEEEEYAVTEPYNDVPSQQQHFQQNTPAFLPFSFDFEQIFPVPHVEPIKGQKYKLELTDVYRQKYTLKGSVPVKFTDLRY